MLYLSPDNPVVMRCGEGLRLEREGNSSGAYKVFQQAWNETTNDWEKIIVAHYLGRYQQKPLDKLQWDEIALQSALKAGDAIAKASYSPLYLEMATCYEELGNLLEAIKYYHLALAFSGNLTDDGFGRMIFTRINSGLERVKCIVQPTSLHLLDLYHYQINDPSSIDGE